MKKSNMLLAAAVTGLFAVSAHAKMNEAGCTKAGGAMDATTHKCMKDGKELKCKGGKCKAKDAPAATTAAPAAPATPAAK